MKNLKSLFFVFLSLFIFSCGNDQAFQKTPIDELIKDYSNERTFSVILYDMDVEEGTFSDTYKHQYRVITEKDSTPVSKETKWYVVSQDYFRLHQNNMGMEVVAKDSNGKLHKTVSPPGFTNHVGNSQYGNWRTDNSGNSFWEFYGRYAMMSSMMNMAMMPVYRSHYTDYNQNYRGSRPYYGTASDGKPMYGTQSSHIQQSKPSFFQRMQSKSAWTKSSTGSSTNTRSGSRYSGSSSSSGSSTRSRGGGSGK